MKRERDRTRRWRMIATVAVVAAVGLVSGCPDGSLLDLVPVVEEEPGGTNGGSDPDTYTVSFDRQGGTGGSTSVDATFGSPMPSATAPTKTGFLFDGYYTGANGTGTQYYTASMQSARNWDLTSNTELIASWVDYEIGDTGPAGGIVFYDKGSYSDGWRYLEAAPASREWTDKPWGGYGTEVGTAAQGTAIGTGAANTQAIVGEYGNNEPYDDRSDYAAKLCDDLDYGGYSDWFLPSKDELDLMFQNLHQAAGLGHFASAYYWSSSESDAPFAWGQYFDNGNQYDYDKINDFRVRAARAF